MAGRGEAWRLGSIGSRLRGHGGEDGGTTR